MTDRLNSILLIDDDDATNFVHEFAIKKANCTDNIIIAENGLEGLEYLLANKDKSSPQPSIIFLDINMPVMDGWQFIEEYEKLDKDKQEGIVLIMLTTSLNPDDAEKAKTYSSIDGFRNKPLTTKMIGEIIEEYFTPIQENVAITNLEKSTL